MDVTWDEQLPTPCHTSFLQSLSFSLLWVTFPTHSDFSDSHVDPIILFLCEYTDIYPDLPLTSHDNGQLPKPPTQTL